MLYIKQLRPCLNVQLDSLRAKVFVYFNSVYVNLSDLNSFELALYSLIGFYTSCSATFCQLLAFRATFEQLLF